MTDVFEGSPLQYLEREANKFPEEKAIFAELSELYKSKLWYQISERLIECTRKPFFQTEARLVKLYENFVQKFGKKLSPLRFGRFAIAASCQHSDPVAGLQFLSEVEKLVSDHEGKLLIKMEMSRKKTENKDFMEAKQMIEEGKKALDSYHGVMEPSVHSQYYLAAMEYYKAAGPAADYYSNSLLYLTYTPLMTISTEKQKVLAAELSLAALIGKNIYNFGELLQQPILHLLKNTDDSWKRDLLYAFNSGDIKKFEEITSEHKEEKMVPKMEFLHEKIRLMNIMEMVFRKPSSERNIPFKEIAAHAQCPIDQVEILLMRGFSMGLLKGKIDQVDQHVRISWVEPRVLDMKQIGSLQKRFSDWAGEVDDTVRFMEDSAPELLIAGP